MPLSARIITNRRCDVNEKFQSELKDLINIHGIDNALETPDFLLAQMIVDMLSIIGKGILARDTLLSDALNADGKDGGR